MQTLTLPRLRQARGTVQIPGSKSLSNRILLLAALCKGTTRVSNLLVSDDIRYMLDALYELGIPYYLSDDGTECRVVGQAGELARGQVLTLFLGNAGTAMRPLAAALCAGSKRKGQVGKQTKAKKKAQGK